MKNHDMQPTSSAGKSSTGKWICTTNEEHWDSSEEFDTREDAIAYAITGFAEDCNLEDGDSVFVGQICEVSLDQLAASATSADSMIDAIADSMIDAMCGWLYDNAGEGAEESIAISAKEAEELHVRVTSAIRAWMSECMTKPEWRLVEKVSTHPFAQCAEVREEARCALHANHDGEHEWP